MKYEVVGTKGITNSSLARLVIYSVILVIFCACATRPATPQTVLAANTLDSSIVQPDEPQQRVDFESANVPEEPEVAQAPDATAENQNGPNLQVESYENKVETDSEPESDEALPLPAEENKIDRERIAEIVERLEENTTLFFRRGTD